MAKRISKASINSKIRSASNQAKRDVRRLERDVNREIGKFEREIKKSF
ncbi:hypothetical protein ACM26V_06965 [Salipaludibacillus sp. HK11]